jgi:16S rRNA pseudouridine516 synthase
MQLERILHRHGFGTRKACRTLVWQGRVAIDGTVCEDPLAEIATNGLVFSVDGTDWRFAEYATLVLNKPAGYECSRNPQFHASVLELLPPPLRERGVQPVGRLDQDATGLLLITDDGRLNHALSSARHRVPKTYLVTIKHRVDPVQVQGLLDGVMLNGEPEPVAAVACEIAGDFQLRLTVSEGKYHQVKRMVAAVSNRVVTLHREAIGNFSLPPELAPGQWRWVSAGELDLLANPSRHVDLPGASHA